MAFQSGNEHAVQIMDFQRVPNRAPSMSLNRQTLKGVLSQAKGYPIHLLSICGASRQGKSFLMSILINVLLKMEAGFQEAWECLIEKGSLSTAFHFENNDDRQTVGCWMWSKPFFLKRTDGSTIALLLMDTQGVFDRYTSEREWSMLVGISLMASTTIIYNLMGNLLEDQLNILGRFLDFGMLSLSENPEGKWRPFQDLLFLIRDWNIPESFKYGSFGGALFLAKKLDVTPDVTKDAKRVRELMRTCFEDISCFLMPHPGEIALKNDYKGDLTVLRPEFRSNVQKFLELILVPDTLKEKHFMGGPVTSDVLFNIFDKYIEIFNGVELPESKPLIEAASEIKIEAKYKECAERFGNELESVIGGRKYVSPEELNSVFKTIYPEILKQFEELTKNIGLPKFKKKQQSGLQNEMITAYHTRKESFQDSKSLMRKQCVEQCLKLYEDTVNGTMQNMPILPEQFEQLTSHAEHLAYEKLKQVSTSLDADFFSDFAGTLQKEMGQKKNNLQLKNTEWLSKEQKQCEEAVLNCIVEFRDGIDLVRISGGPHFTESALLIARDQLLTKSFGKFSTHCIPKNPELKVIHQRILESKVKEIVSAAQSEINHLNTKKEDRCLEIVNGVTDKVRASMMTYFESRPSLTDIHQHYLLQKATCSMQLSPLYTLHAEKAQEFIDMANLHMDSILIELEKIINREKQQLGTKIERKINEAFDDFVLKTEGEMRKPRFVFEKDFNTCWKRWRDFAADPSKHIAFTKEEVHCEAFRRGVEALIDDWVAACETTRRILIEENIFRLEEDLEVLIDKYVHEIRNSLDKSESLQSLDHLHQECSSRLDAIFQNYTVLPSKLLTDMSSKASRLVIAALKNAKTELQSRQQATSQRKVDALQKCYQSYLDAIGDSFPSVDTFVEPGYTKFHQRCLTTAQKNLKDMLISQQMADSEGNVEKELEKKITAHYHNNKKMHKQLLDDIEAGLANLIKNAKRNCKGKVEQVIQKSGLNASSYREMEILQDDEISAFEDNYPSLLAKKERKVTNDLRTQLRAVRQDAVKEFEKSKQLKNQQAYEMVKSVVGDYESRVEEKIGEKIVSERELQAIHKDVMALMIGQVRQRVTDIESNEGENIIKSIGDDMSSLFNAMMDRNADMYQQALRSIEEDVVEFCVKANSYLENKGKADFETFLKEEMLRFQSSIEPRVNMSPEQFMATMKNVETRILSDCQEKLGKLPNNDQVELYLVKCRTAYHEIMKKIEKNPKALTTEELDALHHNACLQAREKVNVPDIPALRTAVVNILDRSYRRYVDLNIARTNELDGIAIGIDLGTTYSCVAVFRHGGIEMIPDVNTNNCTTPSYVLYANGKKQEKVVGEVAKKEALIHPGKVVFDSKRLIGKKFKDATVQEDMKLWPFDVVEEKGLPKFKIGEETIFPEEVSKEILTKLKLDAEKYLNVKVTKAVITVPAYFSDSQRQATMDAGEIAGLEVLGILNEPTAAAVAYSLSYTEDKCRNVLVYDLGGGTFDVSVLTIRGGEINVLAVGGDNHLGGQDFDNAMLDYCVKEFQEKEKCNVRDDPRSVVDSRLRRIRHVCEAEKIALSVSTTRSIICESLLPEKDLNVEITRDKFNELNAQRFNHTIDVVRNALQEAKLHPKEVDDILLVGGSSRIPQVQQLLSDLFPGKPLTRSINPDEVVARGAAIFAAIKSGAERLREINFSDVNPHSLGVYTLGDVFSTIIRKNTTIPTTETQTYFTTSNNQTEVKIQVYEGEDPVATNNNLLGKFTLKGIPKAPAGSEKIDVTLSLNEHGILNVTACIKSTGGSESVQIEAQRTNLSAERIKELQD